MKKYFLSGWTIAALLVFIFGCKKNHTLPKIPPPSWTVQDMARYPATMTAVVQVPKALLKHVQQEDRLAAFIKDSCRGSGKLVQKGDISVFFILIHGAAASGGMIQFKYYSSLKSHLYATDTLLPFVVNGNYGTVDHPKILSLSAVK